MARVNKRQVAEHSVQQEKQPYLTKRMLVNAAAKGFKKASEEAMQLMGYIVIAQDGWVVKKYADGKIEKLSLIEQVSHPNVIALD